MELAAQIGCQAVPGASAGLPPPRLTLCAILLHYRIVSFSRSGHYAGAHGQVAGIVRQLGTALLAAGTLIIAYQAMRWLRFGYWAEVPLNAPLFWLGYPSAGELAGLWLFRQPLSVVSFGVGAAMIWMGRNPA
jgi:hypothetical protein